MHRAAVVELAESLELTPKLVEGRLAALGLDDDARARLRAIAPLVLANASRFLDSFYARLLDHAATRGYFRTPEEVARLKTHQLAYIEELFTAEYDWEHALRCLHIGLAHHRVRLTPQWFVASFGHFVLDHVPLVFAASGSVEEAVETVTALVKSVLFDASLTLEGYAMSAVNASRSSLDLPAEDGSHKPAAAVARVGAEARAPAVTRSRVALDDASERSLFLGINAEVRAALHALAPAVETAIPEVLNEFYELFSGWGETRDLVPANVAERLKREVASYWSELVRSEFDRPYAASRTLVGIVHERVGLPSPLYLVGLARQVSSLLRRAATKQADVDALLRAVFFDVSFVLQAYLDARAAAVLRSEGFAVELLSGLSSGVAVVDAKLRISVVNPALLTMFGLDARLARHVHLRQAVPFPEAASLARRAWDEPLAARVSCVANHEGRVFRMTALRLEGTAESVALVLDDITELVHAQRDVDADDRTYADVLDAVQSFVWELDEATEALTTVSRSVVNVAGVRDVALLGRRGAFLELLPERERAAIKSIWRAAKVGQRAEVAHRLQRPSGETVWVRSTFARGTTSEGHAVVRGTSVDVTALRRAEQHRLDAIGKLAGGIAHEYHNQLTVVLSSLSLLDAPGGAADLSLIEEARTATERCAALTKRLLSVAQRQMLRPRSLVLNDMLGRAKPSLARQVGDRVELEMHLDPDLWPCNVDAEELEVALSNVLSNASDSMPAGGRVTVATRNLRADEALEGVALGHDDFVEIAIEDAGRGMDETVRRRAFEPFFSTDPGKSGLGLALVHGFVAQSGGHVLLASERGKGTTVRMLFPRASAPTTGGPRAEGRPVVVAVDDQPAVRRVLRRLFEAMGYAVVTAGSSEETLALLSQVRPDVLVTDVVLAAGDSGSTLARLARERDPSLPIVFISGYPREELDLGGLGDGTWFVAKPFAKDSLESALRQALGSRPRATA